MGAMAEAEDEKCRERVASLVDAVLEEAEAEATVARVRLAKPSIGAADEGEAIG